MSTTEKGRLVEKVVALLHDEDSVKVERNVFLPSRGRSGRPREIDVLISSRITHYPIRLAVECKNLKKPVGVENIDKFIGKLDDVGIPPQLGIFVSASGYTRGARERAEESGIRPLILRGLTADRLAVEIRAAVQSIVYLLCDLTEAQVEYSAPVENPAALTLFVNDGADISVTLGDLVWTRWRDRQIPLTLGEHEVQLELPADWHLAENTSIRLQSLIAKVQVRGLLISVPGQVERVSLAHAANMEVERIEVSGSFDIGDQPLQVRTVSAESELDALISAIRATTHVVSLTRIPLPRIQWRSFYWPPSERAMERFGELGHRVLWNSPGAVDELSKITFQEIEGTDLRTMWDPIAKFHPASSDWNWPNQV